MIESVDEDESTLGSKSKTKKRATAETTRLVRAMPLPDKDLAFSVSVGFFSSFDLFELLVAIRFPHTFSTYVSFAHKAN
jgi:hypothetical protein